VYGFEEADDIHCLVMELVPGQTLAEQLTSGRLLKTADAVSIGIGVAEALESAHRQGITHRDIKPANVKVTPEGRVKVLDFGLAKLVTTPDVTGENADAMTLNSMTRAGDFVGTPSYMSPEQLRNEVVDQRTDIWAFGCLMFELVSGRRPFAGNSIAEIIANVLTVEPNWTILPADVPPGVRELIRRCLTKDREARLPDISQARAALASVGPPFEPVIGQREAIGSLAVLPFDNTSGDPEMEYLSDGLTENITFSLSQLPRLRLMSRSAVSRYKGSSDDTGQVGRTLGVPAVVTGRVRQRGNAILISAELIEVATGLQLWGAQYRRPARDIFAIEEEIAREISEALRLKFTPAAQERLARRRAENVEAYHLYLKGRFHWAKRTEEGLYRGLEYFRQAIELDPTYALAHAGLAEIYLPLTHYCYVDPPDAMPKARAAANRALEIEPEMPEAVTVIASVKANYEWDLAGAVELLQQAIARDPKNGRARQVLAECLFCLGRFAECTAEIDRALNLDPLSLHMNAAVVMDYFFVGRYTEAVERAHRAIELDINFFPTRYYLGLAYEQTGEFDRAITQFETARALSNNCTLVVAALGHAYAAAGRKDEARAVQSELDDIRRTRYVSPSAEAAIHVALGETSRALDLLDRAFNGRCVWLLRSLTADPRFKPLQGEHRFQDLMLRVSAGRGE
jgi:TolB-like protein/Flp pilus assembly protein TadD